MGLGFRGGGFFEVMQGPSQLEEGFGVCCTTIIARNPQNCIGNYLGSYIRGLERCRRPKLTVMIRLMVVGFRVEAHECFCGSYQL